MKRNELFNTAGREDSNFDLILRGFCGPEKYLFERLAIAGL
jgi:hypothetical protein